MMEYHVFKASTISIITAFTRHQLSIDMFFSLLSIKYGIKIQILLSEGFLDKILHSKSRTQCFSREYFFLDVCLSKRYTKVPDVVFGTPL